MAGTVAICLSGQLRGACSAADVESFRSVFTARFARADVFLVASPQECDQARSLFAPLAYACPDEVIEDRDRTFLEEFPRQFNVAWDENAESAARRWQGSVFARKGVYQCLELLDNYATRHGIEYEFVARARPDVAWGSFPPLSSLRRARTIWVNFEPDPMQPVVTDQFAIGPPDLMRVLMLQYLFVANMDNWKHFHSSVPWCVEHLTKNHHHCMTLFPEPMLERYLVLSGVPYRKNREICFDRITECGVRRTAFCSHLAPTRHPHGYIWSDPRHYLENDYDLFQTAQGVYPAADPILATRLAVWLLAEGRRIQKRLSVIDFGAGRGETVDALVKAGLAAVGVDGNYIVRRTLPGLGVVADLAAPLDLAGVQRVFQPYVFDSEGVRGSSPRCTFERRSFAAAPPLDLLRLGKKAEPPVSVLEYLCCEDAFCRGFEHASGSLFSGHPEPGHGVELYVRTTEPPGLEGNPGGNETLADQLSTLYSKLATGQADWVISLDVGEHIPARLQRTFIENIARTARRGVVLSWGASGTAAKRSARFPLDRLDLEPRPVNPLPPAHVAELFDPTEWARDTLAEQALRSACWQSRIS